MKFYALIAAVLLQSHAGFAAENFSGKVIASSLSVRVLTDRGVVAQYAVTPILDTADVFRGDVLTLSQGGVTTRCPPLLGSLAEDFTVTIELRDGTKMRVDVAKSNGQRKVSVFGTCGGSGQLTELHFNLAPRGELLKITNLGANFNCLGPYGDAHEMDICESVVYLDKIRTVNCLGDLQDAYEVGVCSAIPNPAGGGDIHCLGNLQNGFEVGLCSTAILPRSVETTNCLGKLEDGFQILACENVDIAAQSAIRKRIR
jgi:hypothetical protein